MKKKIFVFILLMTVVLAGCNDTNKNDKVISQKEATIEELNSKIAALEKEMEELKSKDQISEFEKENFPFLSNATLDFTRAQISGDQEKLKTLITENLTLEVKEDGLYIINQTNGDEWLLNAKGYEDMTIQGYGYDEAKKTMSVHTRQFFQEADLPTFLTLIFIKVNDVWKVTDLYFDV